MEYKHFSHPHNLSPHLMPPGAETNCSGCNFPASGSVFVCWACQFFLHEQCFQAGRSINHPSHPNHPLTLVPYPTYPSGSFICNSCSQPGSGFSYCCSACDFDLHVSCASITSMAAPEAYPMDPNYSTNPVRIQPPAVSPNVPEAYPLNPNYLANHPVRNEPPPVRPNAPEGYPLNPNYPANPVPNDPPPVRPNTPMGSTFRMETPALANNKPSTQLNSTNPYSSKIQAPTQPNQIRHKSHPKHPLKCLSKSPYPDGEFTCNACGDHGTGSVYNCFECQYDLHAECTTLPETVTRNDHKHPLSLAYSLPLKGPNMAFECDVCHRNVHEALWLYYCKACDFGTHVVCVQAKERNKEEVELEKILKAQQEMQRLQLQLQANRISAQLLSSSINAAASLIG